MSELRIGGFVLKNRELLKEGSWKSVVLPIFATKRAGCESLDASCVKTVVGCSNEKLFFDARLFCQRTPLCVLFLEKHLVEIYAPRQPDVSHLDAVLTSYTRVWLTLPVMTLI